MPLSIPPTPSPAAQASKRNRRSRNLQFPSRDQVIETVIDIFVRTIGFVDRNEVSRTTHVIKNFFIDTDDLSLFALEVDKHFGIRTPPSEDWPGAEPTIEAIADRVLAYLQAVPPTSLHRQ